MADWANLRRFVKRVSELAMIDEDDAGKHVQGLLFRGKIKARESTAEKTAIPPHYWGSISVDWRKLDDSDYFLSRYKFILGDDEASYPYYAADVEIPAADAHAFLRQLGHEDLPPVSPQATNLKRGGRPTTHDWAALSADIAVYLADTDLGDGRSGLNNRARAFFASADKAPDIADLNRFVRKAEETYQTLRKDRQPAGTRKLPSG